MSQGWWWAAGAATVVMTAALIGLLSFYGGRTPPVGKERQQTAQEHTNPERMTNFGPRTAIARNLKHYRRQVHSAEVKTAVFPTPSPLSQQEKFLLRYLAGTPRQEVEAQSHPDPPPDDVAFADDSELFGGENSNRSTRNNQ